MNRQMKPHLDSWGDMSQGFADEWKREIALPVACATEQEVLATAR